MRAHEIDYEIYGEEMQYVEIELDPQEAVIAEAGSFMMMDSGIKMDTIFGSGTLVCSLSPVTERCALPFTNGLLVSFVITTPL